MKYFRKMRKVWHGFDEAIDERDVIIRNDQENSIQALTNIDPDAFWGDNGLVPLLKKK
jgi:hypothetical protein